MLGYLFPRAGIILGFLLAGILSLIILSDPRLPWWGALPVMFIITHHYYYTVVVLLMVMSWCLWWLNEGGKENIIIPFWGSFLGIIILSLYALTRSIDPYLGFYFFRYSLLLPLLGLILVVNLPWSNSEVKTTLLFIGGSLAVLGWVSLLFGLWFGWERKILGWTQMNWAAAGFAMMTPMALMMSLVSKKDIERFLVLFVLGGLIAGMVAAKTRAMLAALLVTILVIARIDRTLRRYLIPLLVVILGSAVLLFLPRIMMLFGKGEIPDWSAVGRVEVWMNSLSLIPRYFWWGMGLDSFREIYPALFPRAFLRAPHPHNIYLQWLFDYGFLGTLLLLSIIVRVLVRWAKQVKNLMAIGLRDEARLRLGLGGGILTILIGGVMDSYLQVQIAFLFWVMIGFIIVLLKEPVKLPSS